MAEMKPFWVRGGRRSIVDHPDEIRHIMEYLRRHGDLRANAKHVELLWEYFSENNQSNWMAATDTALESFVNWLENMSDFDYHEVVTRYDKWRADFKM